jgi:hypothetical protein
MPSRSACADLGVVRAYRDCPNEAEVALRHALAIDNDLVADFPTVPDCRFFLAWRYLTLADFLRCRGQDYGASRKMFEKSDDSIRGLLSSNAHKAAYRRLSRLHRAYSMILFLVLRELSATSGAQAAAQLLEASDATLDDCYLAGCIFCACIGSIQMDKELSGRQRNEQAQAYADKAMAAFRRAIKKGYKRLDEMKHEPVLQVLRNRDDFKKLLAELEASVKGSVE